MKSIRAFKTQLSPIAGIAIIGTISFYLQFSVRVWAEKLPSYDSGPDMMKEKVQPLSPSFAPSSSPPSASSPSPSASASPSSSPAPPSSPELDEIRRDLAKLDEYAANKEYDDAGALLGQDIKARDIYKGYLARASQMSDELLGIRQKLTEHGDELSLQELGALAQRASLNNLQFKSSFIYGENEFHTYILIETAVHNLEEAISYWRTANRYRRPYRGGVPHKVVDDEILKTHLQSAINAIDELKVIIDAREVLNRDLNED
jgi:hypothetical protein